MNWQDLAGPLIRLGAPTIGGILAGPGGAAIGDKIGGIVSEALGTDPTPEAVHDEIRENPERVPELESADVTAMTLNALANQAALFQREDARGWFHHAWRPALSWLLIGLWLWNALIIRLVIALGGNVEPVPWEQLVAFSGLWLAIYGGGHTAKSIWGKA